MKGGRPDLENHVIVPDVLIQAHSSALSLAFYDGDAFPAQYRGDAFVAHFLATWWTTGDVDAAVEAGKAGGAMATCWVRPLPDEVYGPLVASQ